MRIFEHFELCVVLAKRMINYVLMKNEIILFRNSKIRMANKKKIIKNPKHTHSSAQRMPEFDDRYCFFCRVCSLAHSFVLFVVATNLSAHFGDIIMLSIFL